MVTRSDIIEIAHKLFDDYDADNSGTLSRAEIKVLVENVLNHIEGVGKIDQAKRDKLFTMCDGNSDNQLSKK